jgi:hypothetical protein
MGLKQVGYIVACIVAPVAWGLIVVWASNRVERMVSRRKRLPDRKDPSEEIPLDYHI